jgi:hypothetical protein
MAHQTFKIRAGVEVNETPTLNQAGISSCQLIRFKPDDQGMGLPEKLGGWAKLYASPMPTIPRCLWAWEDLDADTWLAVGCESVPPLGSPPTTPPLLGVMLANVDPTTGLNTGQSLTDITPLFLSSDVVVNFSTVAGSSTVTIVDSTSPALTVYDAVYVTEQVSIGGLVLFGMYQIIAAPTLGSCEIRAADILGNPLLAATTVANGGTVPLITTILASAIANVNLIGHGYSVGSTFTVLVPTTVGGILFVGDYVVTGIVDADNFTITAATSATSAATNVPLNGGEIRLVYNLGANPPSSATGYGVGGYGAGGYGVGGSVTINPGVASNARDWALDNWGDTLLASPEKAVIDGIPMSGIYEWAPDSGQAQALIIPQAPTVNDGFFMAMPQRQIVAWGSTFTGIQDPLLLRWCDVDNYNVWVATVTNQAGSYRFPRGSKIVAGLQTAQQGLIWTDLAVWSMQYISQPYVYSFNEISTGCGLLAQKGCGTMNGIVYWISQTQFYKLDSSGVAPINCPIWDVIFQDLDLLNTDKIRCATNSRFGEVAWYYPSKSSGAGENDSYVKYNTVLNVWDYGKLGRTAWLDQSVAGPPIGADPSSLYIYQHEISPDADGSALVSWFTTGFFTLSDGDNKIFIDEVWPDMKWGYQNAIPSATVQITFGVTDFPGQPVFSSGPFNLTINTTFLSLRVRGRLVQITVGSSDVGSFWRIGGLRYRAAPDGRY